MLNIILISQDASNEEIAQAAFIKHAYLTAPTLILKVNTFWKHDKEVFNIQEDQPTAWKTHIQLIRVPDIKWVPSYFNVLPGNETADRLARKSLSCPNRCHPLRLSLKQKIS